ncbi:PadR family transcriptional regulator [Rhodococcus sp. NPDC058514]|uniref:PadR family transcriptional regulator n=1 Tax=unclassified Rhodococcus (in: high G+C Gram-positive bacteria) TaxID=192944 RepID=UPI003657E544
MATAALTPLAITVLALLNERPMHPYEMHQLLLQRHVDRVVKVRPGSLYHAVARLERAELIAVRGTEREGNRPERTTYDVTAAGRIALEARIAELLGAPVREYPQFPLALAEAHNLPAADVCRLLRDRIAAVEADLDELDTVRAMHTAADRPRVFWFGLDYQRALAATELDWMTALVAEIESGELPWLTPELIRERLSQPARG